MDDLQKSPARHLEDVFHREDLLRRLPVPLSGSGSVRPVPVPGPAHPPSSSMSGNGNRGVQSDGGTDPGLLSAWFRRMVGSDETALESIFRATYDGLFHYAQGIVGDEAGARDVVQEAFIRLWNRRVEHDPSGSVRGLLYRTVRNLALNQERDRKRRAELLRKEYEPPRAQPDSPEDLVSVTSLRECLARWIDELPERQREALRLSRFQGLSHAEIAQVMDVSPRTVNNHLVRGLRSLREQAVAHGVELPSEGRTP